ncbi:hypothetical protein ACR6C2_07875 [Streptomyces sp. INA 01156]
MVTLTLEIASNERFATCSVRPFPLLAFSSQKVTRFAWSRAFVSLSSLDWSSCCLAVAAL